MSKAALESIKTELTEAIKHQRERTTDVVDNTRSKARRSNARCDTGRWFPRVFHVCGLRLYPHTRISRFATLERTMHYLLQFETLVDARK